MAVQVSDPTVMVNNVVVAVVPNSVTFTEGFGEQEVFATSTGGGNIEPVFSDNVETHFSMVKFEMRATVENIQLQRDWKANKNANLIQITGRTPEGDVTRTFTQAALTNDAEVGLGSDKTIALEFKTAPAI